MGGLKQFEARDELDHVGELSGGSQLTDVSNLDLSALVLELEELSTEETLQHGNGSRGNDDITASSISTTDTLGSQPLFIGSGKRTIKVGSKMAQS